MSICNKCQYRSTDGCLVHWPKSKYVELLKTILADNKCNRFKEASALLFEREERYTVLKISDVHEALDPDECTTLIELEEKIAICRELRGKQPLQAVVVEADWPEYEPTWAAIEQRVNQESLK